MTFKIGIIGIGKIAQDQHLPVIKKNLDFRLAAIVSQRGIQYPGVPTFKTPAEMYDAVSDLDAVAICTPPGARHRIAKQALASGKHILLEKPPTPTLSELSDLVSDARQRNRIVFTTWHSQFNRAVDEAKAQLADSRIDTLDVEWKEDVRRWHPGQEWIWRPGGFGVFDPGINALSIVTKIMPQRIFVAAADLAIPRNRETPIAASLTFKFSENNAASLTAEFDWRQTGEQTWNITLGCDDGRTFKLTKGGAKLVIDGKVAVDEPPAEYEDIYRRFADLLTREQSDVDVAPLQLVADAFMIGRHVVVEPFNERATG